MNDPTANIPCTDRATTSYALCFRNDNTSNEDCKHVVTYMRIIEADCYLNKVFYHLVLTLIVIGTCLNIFSLYCFLKMKKRHSTNIYLSVLSLGDTINLHLNFSVPLLRHFSETFDGIFLNSMLNCRLSGVLTEFFLIFPTWIVVLLSIEALIIVVCPSKRHASYTHKRTKISVVILIFIVLVLSSYRVVDLKGIDQVSVFSVLACNSSEKSFYYMRHINLIIWSILPECCTFVVSLIIIYNIEQAKKHFHHDNSKARRAKYNQATKTVILLSILFLIFHTPTGILIGLNLLHSKASPFELSLIMISRKFTVLLYELSLCCKFFIYYQTFRDFKGNLGIAFNRLFSRTNSAKLGRPTVCAMNGYPNHQRYHFVPRRSSPASLTSQTESLIKATDDHRQGSIHRNRQASSISLPRNPREKQPQSIIAPNGTCTTRFSLTNTGESKKCIKLTRKRTT